jgi:hypothetical protein
LAFSVPGRRRRDDPGDGHHELGPDAAGHGMGLGRIGLVDHDLRDAVAVAQVEEDQRSVVAPPVDPAGQAARLPASDRAQLPQVWLR